MRLIVVFLITLLGKFVFLRRVYLLAAITVFGMTFIGIIQGIWQVGSVNIVIKNLMNSSREIFGTMFFFYLLFVALLGIGTLSASVDFNSSEPILLSVFTSLCCIFIIILLISYSISIKHSEAIDWTFTFIECGIFSFLFFIFLWANWRNYKKIPKKH